MNKTIKKNMTYLLEVASTHIETDKNGLKHKYIPMSFHVKGSLAHYKQQLRNFDWETKTEKDFNELLDLYTHSKLLESLGVTIYPIPEKEATQ